MYRNGNQNDMAPVPHLPLPSCSAVGKTLKRTGLHLPHLSDEAISANHAGLLQENHL